MVQVRVQRQRCSSASDGTRVVRTRPVQQPPPEHALTKRNELLVALQLLERLAPAVVTVQSLPVRII